MCFFSNEKLITCLREDSDISVEKYIESFSKEILEYFCRNTGISSESHLLKM